MRIVRLISMLALLAAIPVSAADKSNPAAFSDLPAVAEARISATLGHDSAEFYARPMRGGFAASSRGLTTRFTSTGVEVSSGSARWGLALQGYGYGDALAEGRGGTTTGDQEPCGVSAWSSNRVVCKRADGAGAGIYDQ